MEKVLKYVYVVPRSADRFEILVTDLFIAVSVVVRNACHGDYVVEGAIVWDLGGKRVAVFFCWGFNKHVRFFIV